MKYGATTNLPLNIDENNKYNTQYNTNIICNIHAHTYTHSAHTITYKTQINSLSVSLFLFISLNIYWECEHKYIFNVAYVSITNAVEYPCLFVLCVRTYAGYF